MPGIKVRKIKLIICLKMGISKPEAASHTKARAASRKASDIHRHFLSSQSLGSTITLAVIPTRFG